MSESTSFSISWPKTWPKGLKTGVHVSGAATKNPPAMLPVILDQALSIRTGHLVIIESGPEHGPIGAMAKSALIGRLAGLHDLENDRGPGGRLATQGYAGPYSSAVSFLTLIEQVEWAVAANRRVRPDREPSGCDDPGALLDRLGVDAGFHCRRPDQLPPDKRPRLCRLAQLAGALAPHPPLIFLDEPPVDDQFWAEVLAERRRQESAVVLGLIGSVDLPAVLRPTSEAGGPQENKTWQCHRYSYSLEGEHTLAVTAKFGVGNRSQVPQPQCESAEGT